MTVHCQPLNGESPRRHGSVAIRGWVYVISNHAMPGLVKVGFTLKDPALRAREPGHTGMPSPYQVVYEILLDEPRSVEQRAHRQLAKLSAGKEWFKCSAETAISAIRSSYSGPVHAENFLRLSRQQVERKISVERLRAEENARLMQEDTKRADATQQQVREIRKRYEEAIATSLEVVGFGWYWATASITIVIAFAWLLPNMDENLGMVLAAIFGAVAAFFSRGARKNRRVGGHNTVGL